MCLVKSSREEYESEVGDDLRYGEIIREYVCENCNSIFCHRQQRFDAFRYTDCPACNFPSLNVVIGDVIFSMNNVTTIGKQADVNLKKMGTYQRSEMEEKQKPAKEQKERKSHLSKINKMTDEQKQRYIMTGK